jgi:hypothetical protein
MLRAELRGISPNDYPSWEAFVAAEPPEPWDAFGWFVLDVGVEGERGSTFFQALVATPAAVTRARGNARHRRVLVVESLEPQALETALRDHVASASAHTWDDIVAKLRRTMYWEYEPRWS